MNITSLFLQKLVVSSIVLLGCWAAYAQLSVVLQLNFHQFMSFAWIPLLASLSIYVSKIFSTSPTVSESSKPFPKNYLVYIFCLGIGATIASGIVLQNNQLVGSLLYFLCGLALVAVINREKVPPAPEEQDGDRYVSIVLITMFIAALVPLFTHYVSWDDAYYVNAIATTLDHPNWPLLTYDGIHGVPNLKTNQIGWRLQTYELLVASIGKFLNIPHERLYYIYLPPIWAALSIAAQWLLMRRLAGPDAAVAAVAAFLVLIFWTEGRTYGNFSYLRGLYDGKSIFITLAVPMLVYGSLWFASRPGFRVWLILFLACWCACLFTSTAYVVAPIVIALSLISACRFTLNGFKTIILGTSAAAFCPILLLTVVAGVDTVDADRLRDEWTVFAGDQGRFAYILLALVPFAAAAALMPGRNWLARFVTLSFIAFYNGYSLKWFAEWTSNIFSWRILWVMPAPTLLGIGVASGLSCASRLWFGSKRIRSIGLAVCIATMVGFFVYLHPPSWNFSWPGLKVDKSAYEIARRIVSSSGNCDLVLAPTRISVPLAGMRNAPSLVFARGHYLKRLAVQWGDEETISRKRLRAIIEADRYSQRDITWATEEIRRRNITVIVTRQGRVELDPLRDAMKTLDYDKRSVGRWELWRNTNTVSSRSCSGPDPDGATVDTRKR